ncbi:MAG: hypothetical protein LVQ95_01160 [Candidatus Micrarchaeales archaeon]|nr:hypothetical protein [Candidatus Micrarchaeales archaeon]
MKRKEIEILESVEAELKKLNTKLETDASNQKEIEREQVNFNKQISLASLGATLIIAAVAIVELGIYNSVTMPGYLGVVFLVLWAFGISIISYAAGLSLGAKSRAFKAYLNRGWPYSYIPVAGSIIGVYWGAKIPSVFGVGLLLGILINAVIVLMVYPLIKFLLR